MLSGPVEIPSLNTCSSNITVSHVLETDSLLIERDNELNGQLVNFCYCQELGMKNDNTTSKLENIMKGKIKFDGEGYKISLPVKDEISTIPDNYSVPKKRPTSLLNCMNSKPGLFDQYDGVIKDQIETGIVENVNKDTDNYITLGNVHYIPHSAVLKDGRNTTKLRIVYDTSCKVTLVR